MKKVSLVVMERDCETFLSALRELGVIHPERKRVVSALRGSEDRNRRAMIILDRYSARKGVPAPLPSGTFSSRELSALVLGKVDEKETLLRQLVYLERETRRVEAWGDFNPNDFAFLERHGVTLFLYSLSRQALKRIGKEINYIIISREKQWVKILTVGTEIGRIPPFKLPSRSLSHMADRIKAIRSHIGGIDTEIADLACHRESITEDMNRISEEMDYEMTRAGMGILRDDSVNTAVAWLSGFVPCEKIDAVIQFAKKNGCTLAWDDPASADRPPTILRNKPAVRIIQPLFSMLGTIPGYWEFDISLSYMVFLCLFFAMIFGDAGYGLLLFAVSAVLGFFFKKKGSPAGTSAVFPDLAKLGMLLSGCTVLWGIVTGSWFAIPVWDLPPVLRSLIIPPFNNTGPLEEFPPFLRHIFTLPREIPMDKLKTEWNIQFLCFTVGLVQLIWARGKILLRALPSLAAAAQAGWILAMTGIYFLVLDMLLKMPPPAFVPAFIAGGIALNFIFAEQKGGNFFSNVLKGFTGFFSIFLKAIGAFADIISYIRLFAVGIAGTMIGQTFTSMAIPSGGLGSFSLGFILRLIVAGVVLVCGHALNLLMNTLSVIIHGVRLNLLEYAGNHLGMDWSGYAYEPFAYRRKEPSKKEAL